MNKLHITEGNTKIGRIPNVSLPPLITCQENPPCAKLCYARKAYEGYARSTCGPAWDDNLAYYRTDPVGYFDAIVSNLKRRRSAPYFRWHVGGDIVDIPYYEGMQWVADELPETRFLAYTRHWWAASEINDMWFHPNLTIIRSLWLDEVETPEERDALLTPWFKVLLKDSIEATCPGECSKCHRCWYLKPGMGMTIALH